MAEAAAEKVRRKYSWESVAEQTEALYNEVLTAYRQSDWHAEMPILAGLKNGASELERFGRTLSGDGCLRLVIYGGIKPRKQRCRSLTAFQPPRINAMLPYHFVEAEEVVDVSRVRLCAYGTMVPVFMMNAQSLLCANRSSRAA